MSPSTSLLLSAAPNASTTMENSKELVFLFYFLFFSFTLNSKVSIFISNFLIKINRKRVDCECTYHNCCDWVWSSVPGLGYSPAGLDCGPHRHVLVLICHLLHFYPSRRLLPLRRPRFRQEELHLHGCC